MSADPKFTVTREKRPLEISAANQPEQAKKKRKSRNKKKTEDGEYQGRELVDKDGLVIPPLPDFDLSKIKSDASIVVYGMRRTGKSFLSRWLLYNVAQHFPAIVVITETKLNGFWQQFVPEKYVHEMYDPRIIKKIIDIQKARKLQAEKDPNYNPNMCVILDDCISDASLKNDEWFKRLYANGRHLKIFVLTTSQMAKGVNPTVRNNADYAFIFKLFSAGQKESLFEDYLSFMDKKTAAELMLEYTKDNMCLVVSQDSTVRHPVENLYKMKAKDPGQFRMGAREMWEEYDAESHEHQ